MARIRSNLQYARKLSKIINLHKGPLCKLLRSKHAEKVLGILEPHKRNLLLKSLVNYVLKFPTVTLKRS